MTKKYLIICMVATQFIHIFAGEKKQQEQNRRTSDSHKSRVLSSRSEPIFVPTQKKDESSRLSQSSPNLLQVYSPGYYEFGNLGEGFSPYAYDSKR